MSGSCLHVLLTIQYVPMTKTHVENMCSAKMHAYNYIYLLFCAQARRGDEGEGYLVPTMVRFDRERRGEKTKFG